MPRVVVIAGPNGAGKSTLAAEIVGRVFGTAEFVNADTIALGLSGFSPAAVAQQAGRIMLGRLDALAAAGQDFAFETTLASRSFAPKLRHWKALGYEVQLVFLWLSGASLAEARVRRRVARGGHDIPADVVRRRYERGLGNLFNLYLPIADGWTLLDNSGTGQAGLIAIRHPGRPIEILETVPRSASTSCSAFRSPPGRTAAWCLSLRRKSGSRMIPGTPVRPSLIPRCPEIPVHGQRIFRVVGRPADLRGPVAGADRQHPDVLAVAAELHPPLLDL